MSRELIEFSEMIDEQFDITETTPQTGDDFWEVMINLFI